MSAQILQFPARRCYRLVFRACWPIAAWTDEPVATRTITAPTMSDAIERARPTVSRGMTLVAAVRVSP